MAEMYIEIIASGLQEFDNSRLSFDQYKALAWEGLVGLEVWNSLSMSQRNKIGSDYQSAIGNVSATCN